MAMNVQVMVSWDIIVSQTGTNNLEKQITCIFISILKIGVPFSSKMLVPNNHAMQCHRITV
jgi:accessory gene regulator protein AgrB